jgi:hypothetical protein
MRIVIGSPQPSIADGDLVEVQVEVDVKVEVDIKVDVKVVISDPPAPT